MRTKSEYPTKHADQHLPWGSDPLPGLAMPAGAGSFTDWVLALPGVWAYWPLQDASGDALDAGPVHADLDPVGTPAYHATGPNSNDLPFAVRLTGSPQNTISDDSFFDTSDVLNAGADGSFTAGAWIKPDSAATSTWRLPVIGTWDLFRTGWVLYLLATTRQLTWATGNGTNTDNLIGPAITNDVWSFVTVVRTSGTDVKLYVNGSEVTTSGTLVGYYADNGHGIRLGAADFATTDPDSFHFYGNMAGAFWVDSPLSGADVLAGYDAATASSLDEGKALLADADGGTYWGYALEVTF